MPFHHHTGYEKNQELKLIFYEDMIRFERAEIYQIWVKYYQF